MGDAQFIGTYSVLLPLGDLAGDNIALVKECIKESDLLDDPAVHSGDPFEKDPHVTVSMGLDFFQKEVAKKVCKEAPKPFHIDIGQFKLFSIAKNFSDGSYHEYDVLYREIDSYELEELHKKIVKETGKAWHQKEFKAHITYAYLKYGKGKEYLETLNRKTDIIKIVNEIRIKKFKEDDIEVISLAE